MSDSEKPKRTNTGIVLDSSAPKYKKGARFTQSNKVKFSDGIKVGLHPEVAAARCGWLPDEFERLLGSNEKFRRWVLKIYAEYEYKRADQVDADTSAKTAIAYLERCRKHWSKKLDVSLAPLAKKAFDRLEKDLRPVPMLTGEQAWQLIIDVFCAEQAGKLFE